MAARTFTAAPAPRAVAPASRAPVQRAPTMTAPKSAVGVPRFAAPQSASQAAPRATTALPASERLSTASTRHAPPAATSRKAPPPSARHTAARHGEVDPRARTSRPDSPFEREAGRLSARLHEPPRAPGSLGARASSAIPANTPSRADAPTAGAAKPSLAHPGLGPSPPPLDATSSQPLPASLRVRLEALTGFDLGAIRVITGPGAERAATALQARAFTQFGRIHLGPTASVSDAALLTHETAHALQQTLPAEPLAHLGLSPAPADMVLRQPFSANPFTDRRLARRALFSPFGLPNLLMPDGVRRGLNWIGDEGLGLRLTRAVPEALQSSLSLMRQLGGIWRIAEREIDAFPDRQDRWTGVNRLAAETDDPSLVAAARSVSDHLPDFLGPRWTRLQNVISLTVRVAALSGRRWEGGLTSLAPRVAAVLDDLASDVGGAFDDFPENSWMHQALRTALGCPSHITTAPAVAAWIAGLRQQADDWIQSLSQRARGFTTAQFDTTTLTKLAALNPAARALSADLRAIAAIMATPDGVITQRTRLTALLPAAQQKLSTLDQALAPPAQTLTYAFNGAGFTLQSWGRAPVLDAFFPNEFAWMDRIGAAFDPWISEQEPALVTTAQETLGGLDRWSAQVHETAIEAETLDQEVPDYDDGWFSLFRRAWAALTGAKEKIIEKLKKQVPLLRDLIELAPRIWGKAKTLFSRFVERIFKEGRILAPLWEFFLGVLGLELPDNFVRDIAQRAGSLLGKILKHPFRFLGNLAAGIFTGLKSFVGNIGNHLLKSLLDWLLGEFDLQPPATLGKIIGALMDRIGFSRTAVCQSIADFLKSKNRNITAAQIETRLEQVIRVGATALRWVVFLFRGQFAEFWQEIKHHLSNLWKWLVDRAVDYVTKKFITELPGFLAEVLATGFFSAIKAIYDAIQTIRRYVEQVYAIVRGIFLAVEQIANNQIAGAAKAVENAAANALSVALGFLARFARLQAVVDYIKAGLEQIKTHVRKGIDAVVKFTGDVWIWLYDLAESGRAWWEDRRAFTDQAGERRFLSYDIGGDGVVFRLSPSQAAKGQAQVQATPPTLAEYLDSITPANAREKEIHGELLNLTGQIDKIKKDSGGSFSAAQGELIQVLFNEVVILLAKLSGQMAPPPTEVKWTPIAIYGDTYGKRMIASPLSADPGGHFGSKPTGTDTALWNKVRIHQSGNDTHYIKGHLLNHHLHGPGTWNNMIPIARSTNSTMERIAEGDVKKAVIGQNKVVHYEVNMVFGQHSPKARTKAEEELPSKIEMSAEELIYRRGKWVPSGVKIINVSPLKNEIR